MGDRVCVGRAGEGGGAVAGEIRRGSAVPHSENARWVGVFFPSFFLFSFFSLSFLSFVSLFFFF